MSELSPTLVKMAVDQYNAATNVVTATYADLDFTNVTGFDLTDRTVSIERLYDVFNRMSHLGKMTIANLTVDYVMDADATGLSGTYATIGRKRPGVIAPPRRVKLWFRETPEISVAWKMIVAKNMPVISATDIDRGQAIFESASGPETDLTFVGMG